MIGTVVGAVVIVVLTACFPQDRALFLVALALWGAACAFVGTLLRNFAAYSAALAGYTAAIIASDQLGTTGGPNGDAFMLAVTRASEICIGIVCAGIVLAGTDLGGAQRRLACLFAALTAEITNGFTGTLAFAGSRFTETTTTRRELTRRVIALDPAIDEAIGESSQLHYRSRVLQTAVDGLLAALAGWRAAAALLAQLPEDRVRQEADGVLRHVPRELRAGSVTIESRRWMAAPAVLRRICEAGARQLIVQPGGTPSLRMLAVTTAETLVGISRALNGLALLMADTVRPVRRRRSIRLYVPDWLPPLVNGGRAFVTIGAVALFWIFTAWPNGALAITWAAITVILFAQRADQAYATASQYMAGSVLAAVFAAFVAFAVLPQAETFTTLSIVIGLYLVPAGALMTQPWRTVMFVGMAGTFVPLLAPANQESYDTVHFYNAALAIVGGSGAGVLSFRLLPPLSAEFRTRRLLALTLRDLRRLVTGTVPRTSNWQERAYGRLSSLPNEGTPLQRAQLLTALSVGTAVIQLRRIGRRLDLGAVLDDALKAFATGSSSMAIARLVLVDRTLASRDDATPAVLRARGLILVVSEALTEHGAYFDGAPA